MNLREIWESAYLAPGDETTGGIESENHWIGEYEIKDNVLILDIGKDFFDVEEDQIDLLEIEGIIRDHVEDLGLEEDVKIKFNLLR